MEWLYVNRLVYCVTVFIVSILLLNRVHSIAIDFAYTDTSSGSSIVGMTETEKTKVKQQLKSDNVFLDKYKGKKVTKEQLKIEITNSADYAEASDDEIKEATDRIFTKIQTINNEYINVIEVILSIGFAYLGYMAPIWLLMFQVKMREM